MTTAPRHRAHPGPATPWGPPQYGAAPQGHYASPPPPPQRRRRTLWPFLLGLAIAAVVVVATAVATGIGSSAHSANPPGTAEALCQRVAADPAGTADPSFLTIISGARADGIRTAAGMLDDACPQFGAVATAWRVAADQPERLSARETAAAVCSALDTDRSRWTEAIDAQFTAPGTGLERNSNRLEAAQMIESTCPRHQQVADLARGLANLLDDVGTDQRLSNGN